MCSLAPTPALRRVLRRELLQPRQSMVCLLRGKSTGYSLFRLGFNASIGTLDSVTAKVPMEEPVIIITVLNTLELFGQYVYIFEAGVSIFDPRITTNHDYNVS